MASIQTNSYGGRYLRLTVYEESYSIPNNTSTVRWTLESIGGNTNTYYTIYQCRVVVNGQTVYNPGTVGWSTYRFPAAKGSTGGTITVSHNSDGSHPGISFQLHGAVYYNRDDNRSGSIPLTHIPRYASITKFNVNKRDETSVSIDYAVSNTCDAVWYSSNNGSSWASLPSNKIVTGLSAGTGYNFKLRVRRQDSQLTTDSGTVYQTTYPYPSISKYNNIKIGESINLELTNPLKRNCTAYLVGDNNAEKLIGSTTGTTFTGMNSQEWKDWLYSTIPDKSSALYKIRLVVESPSRDTTTNGGTYSIIGDGTEVPAFTDFEWSDIDSLAPFLTGQNGIKNPNILIAGLSDVQFKIPVANKAISNFGASLKSYTFSWGGGVTATSDYSSNSDVINKVDNGNTNSISVAAYDKRNQSKVVTKSGLIIIQPTYASCVVNTHRRNGIEATTYLNGAFKYWAGDWANGSERPNKLLRILMFVNDSETGIDITQLVINNSTETIENNIKTLSINPNTLTIHLNGETGGFTVGNAYTLSFKILTGYSEEYPYDNNRLIGSCIVPDGKIGMSRFKDSNGDYHYGINGMPDDNYTQLIHGNLKADNIEGINIKGNALYINGVKAIWFE